MFKHAQLESVKAWIADPLHGQLPLYSRVQRAIRQLILNGTLGVGKPLPATRILATSLNVSRDTVESAYSQLHMEGFIERHVGRGSFVSVQAQRLQKPHSVRKQPVHQQRQQLSKRGQDIYQSGGASNTVTPRPFAQGVPETRTFPLQIWERLQRQVLKEYGTDALTAALPQGVESLRQAIADYINLERGADATAERVLILTSSQQALTLCATVLFDAGEQIFIEDPAYHGARKAFDAAGLECVAVPLDRDGLLVDTLSDITRTATKPPRAVFLTPSHQFPTGATLSLDRRLAIIEWANQHQSWIIEDDYDSEFHYEGKPTACVQGLDPYQRTIYIGTFTKSLFPGLRIGYMVLPTTLVEPMTIARTLLDGHSAAIPQLTLARFITAGHFGAHVRTMRTLYAARRDILAALVQQHLKEFMQPQIPAGGLQMPCIFNCNIPEHQAVAAARQAGIDVLGLSTLYTSGHGKAGFLMGFAAYAPYEMDVNVRKLAAIMHTLQHAI